MNEQLKDTIKRNAEGILSRIAAACARSGRSASDITLVAACKKQPLEKIEAYLEICRELSIKPVLAQNYVQEQREIAQSISASYESHLIGALQKNKAKDAVRLFDVIEAVHSEELALELNRHAKAQNKTQRIFLQINISSDEKKSGFDKNEAMHFVAEGLQQLDALSLEGLMTITRLYDQPSEARPDFAALREFATRLIPVVPNRPSLALSMGMSDDFEYAIEEGATHIRIGTALFGARQ
ncbi:MAG: YggS family pyridoxal phosphate-dependent enzyme [Deltaproteobacteria bacterium]|nr:YggS family pyridoxal phosphate-dependent enzyme [Deltaproteobacteria bacterium]